MAPYEFDDLDGFIESALRSEPFRPVPFGFQRRVEDRLRVAALCERERRRFRRCMTVAGMVMVGLVSAGIFFVFLAGAGGLAASIPGFLGFYDGFVSLAAFWWPGAVGLAVVVACMLGLGSMLLELFYGRWAMTAG